MRKRFLMVVVVVVFLPFITQAQSTGCEHGLLEAPLPGFEGKTICDVINKNNPLTSYAQVLINYFIAFIVAAGVIVIVIAGYMYMTAGGDGSRVSTAKTMITTALVGIFLALGAYTILETVGGDQFFREPEFVLPSRSPLSP